MARRAAGFQLDRLQRGLEPLDWKPMTSTKRTTFASVWDAIEDSHEVAASLRLRAEVANAIIEETRRRKLTQARAAAICGVTQPRISDLMRGRLDLFSLDALIDMAAHLELRTSITVRKRRAD